MNRRFLFICSRNKLRSPTAEAIFSDYPGVEAESAGLNHDADVPLTPELVQWAEIILVMENAHRIRLARRFREVLHGKRVVVLNIPDKFAYMDPELIVLIKRRCAPYLP